MSEDWSWADYVPDFLANHSETAYKNWVKYVNGQPLELPEGYYWDERDVPWYKRAFTMDAFEVRLVESTTGRTVGRRSSNIVRLNRYFMKDILEDMLRDEQLYYIGE